MKNIQKIALLRGVNVGGKNRMKMADLVESLAKAGLLEVRTYIQSGNIGFASRKNCSGLEKLIRDAISHSFGYDVPVMVREQSFFVELIANSPYCKSGKPKFDITQLCATILGQKPPSKAVQTLAELEFSDEYQVAGDVVYLRMLRGYSNTKLTNGFLEKKLGVAATSRNWKTICMLAEM